MTNETLQKLKIPAIGLIVVAILNILIGLYFLFSAIVASYTGITYKNFTEDDRFAFNVGLYGIMILGILSLIAAPVIIYGATKMMRGEKNGLTKASAILAMIPVTSFSFLLGVPFGIWALMVLSKFQKQPNAPNEIKKDEL
ncbi:MAG: hypothetical protein ABIP06_12695 [Pyrinomonadaceae bacterium]